MKKNLLFILTAFLSCLFSVSVSAQCEVDIIFVEYDDNGVSIGVTPTVFCNGTQIQIPVATISGADASYALSSNVGTFEEEFVDDGFITFLNVTDEDIAASNGSFTITFTGNVNTNCVGTITSTFAAIGVNSVYDFCCADATWIDISGETSASTFAPQPICQSDTIIVAFTIFGVEATSYSLSTSNGIFNSTYETSAVIEFDGSSSGIELLLLAQSDLTAINGGEVTIEIVNDTDGTCTNQILFDLDGVTTISEFCNSVAPPANDVCSAAIALSEGENGPFSNANATYSTDEPTASAGCYFSDDEFQTTIWFTFYGSGNDVTITSNNSCAGIGTENDDTQFAIYEDSCTGTEVACNDDINASTSNFLSTVTIPTKNGTLYYLLVDGYNGTAGDFCLEITGSGAPCEVTNPAIGNTNTQVCQVPDEFLVVELNNAGSGSTISYMLTNFNGSQSEYGILAGPQISNTFDISGLPTGELLAWAISSDDVVTSSNGKIGGLQGCFALSNPVFYNILPATNAACLSNTVDLANVQAMNVYPQPANAEATLVLTTQNADAMNLQIVDVAGKVISSREIFVNAGENTINLDIEGFASGIYFVQVANNDGMATAKLIKQ